MIAAVLEFGAVDLLDVDGRPCGEQASLHYDAATTEVVTCRYAGVRRGAPMNASALRQITAVWPSVLGSAAALAGPDATVFSAFNAAIAGTTAPLMFRSLHPDQAVPRLLSAMFKTCLGFTQVLAALLLADEGVADTPLAELGDGGQFLAYLDEQRWLVGQDQVCAGSAPMISAMFDALCGRSEPALAPALDFGDTWTRPVVEAIGVQIAYILVLDALVARGVAIQGARGQPWHTKPSAPWLRAVGMLPGRTPDHARRLFPTLSVPTSVEQMIAAKDSDLAQVEATLVKLVG